MAGKVLRGKSGRNSGGQEFVLCIGRGLVRADGRESFCMMRVRGVRTDRRDGCTGQGENRGETL